MNMRLKSVRFFPAAALLLSMAMPAAAQDTMWKGVFTAAQAARGKESYDRNCSRCHNLALIGSERGPAIKGNTFLSHWEKDTMAGLFTKVRDTMPEGNSGTVSDDVKIDVISYILQQNGVPAGATELTKDLSALEEIRMTSKTIWDGAFTTAQAERGKTALLRNGCNGCHGAELAGDRGPSLKGERFIAAWENGSVNRLLTKIRDTMPPLNAEQVPAPTKLDIVAYLLEVNGFPAGSTELSLDEETLDGIQIVRKGAESAGPPNFALVEVVGCLTELPNSRWALTNSTEPIATKEETSNGEAAKAANDNPMGTQTFDLVSVRPVFNPQAHRGHKMEARGLLYRESNYAELNLTSLEMVGSTCGN
ncbi:MAG TPA: cytochrome c [Terriglobia bacterium]|nr:cytochrome c [Terriglobia bacterium]